MPQSPYLLANISAVKNFVPQKLLSGKLGSTRCLILCQGKGKKNILHHLFSSSLHTSKHNQSGRKGGSYPSFPMFSLDYFFSHSPVRCATKKQQCRGVVKIRLGVPVLTFINIGHRLISHFQVILMLPAQLMWFNSYSLLLGCGDLAAESWPPKVSFTMVASFSLCQFCI